MEKKCPQQYIFFTFGRVSARIWGFRNWGDHQKDLPKKFFLPAIAVVARFARASLTATERRGEGCDNRGSLLAPGLIAATLSFTAVLSGRGR